jgi:hypothetical protein
MVSFSSKNLVGIIGTDVQIHLELMKTTLSELLLKDRLTKSLSPVKTSESAQTFIVTSFGF